jgi:hypothetical protein
LVKAVEKVQTWGGLSTWERYELPLLLFVAAYVMVEISHWLWRTHRLANIQLAMSEASRSLEAAHRLGEEWERGRRNRLFLASLFELYEPLRKELAEILAVSIEAPPDRSRDATGKDLSGGWIIPLGGRLSEIFNDSSDSHIRNEEDARDLESEFLPYAALYDAWARTRFLAQWRQSRRMTSRGQSSGTQLLTEKELDEICQRTESGMNYVVRRLVKSAGSIRIEVDRATYGQIMRTCDSLIEEALIASGLCAETTGRKGLSLTREWLLRTMPARRSVMRAGIDDLLLSPSRRAVGVGLAGVVMRVGEQQSTLVYKKRSFSVGTYPDMYHAVPTGMFNSKSSDERPLHNHAQHVGRVLMTEFFEEIKSVHSLDGFEANLNWKALLRGHLNWWTADPVGYDEASPKLNKLSSSQSLKGLERRLANLSGATPRFSRKHVKIWVTGLGFDLLSLRPEVCCVIGVPENLLGTIRLNDEGTDQHYEFPREDVESIDQIPSPTQWVRSGYLAFCLAADAVSDPKGLDPSAACTPIDFGL